jgi:hypothetical protein
MSVRKINVVLLHSLVSSESQLSEEVSKPVHEIQETDLTEGETIKTKLENKNDEIS